MPYVIGLIIQVFNNQDLLHDRIWLINWFLNYVQFRLSFLRTSFKNCSRQCGKMNRVNLNGVLPLKPISELL